MSHLLKAMFALEECLEGLDRTELENRIAKLRAFLDICESNEAPGKGESPPPGDYGYQDHYHSPEPGEAPRKQHPACAAAGCVDSKGNPFFIKY
jgi:hypothetical protein